MLPRIAQLLILVVGISCAAAANAADLNWNVTSGDWSDPSNWNLSRLPTISDQVNIQNGGTVLITQPGALACYLNIGGSTGSGSIDMTSGEITVKAENYAILGYHGIGTFTQSGGTANINRLYVGESAGSHGFYNLSGTGALLSGTQCVGYSGGLGTFTQTGGTNSVSNALFLGFSGSGTYDLIDGFLSAVTENIGYNTPSTFTQTGGTNLATTENINSVYTQSGGTNWPLLLNITSAGSYTFSGGALDIRGGLINKGILDLASSAVTMNAASNILDFSGGLPINAQFASFNADSHTLVIVPSGKAATFAGSFASYRHDGILHETGTVLTIDAAQSIYGIGTITDHVVCNGTLSAIEGQYIDFPAGLTAGGNCVIDLGTGDVHVNDDTSSISGGSIFSQYGANVFVGDSTSATFTHTGGTLQISALMLGNSSTSGTYLLGGSGVLKTTSERFGPGSFVQTGGTHTTRDLFLDSCPSGSPGYDLSGGVLTADNERLGYNYASVTFFQSGGTHTVSDTLYVGSSAPGTYSLSGSGVLTASHEYIAYLGHKGTFLQSGGTHVVGTESIGGNSSNPGIYNQTGGTHTVGILDISAYGSYAFNGGTLNIGGGLINKGTLNFAPGGGAFNASASIIDLSKAVFGDTSAASFYADAHCLVLVPKGKGASFAGSFAHYENAGILHEVGATIEILAGRSIFGSGTISDHVNCNGILAKTGGSTLTLDNGLTLGANGFATFDFFYVNDSVSGMSGGSLTTNFYQYFGNTNAATFTQTGGTNTAYYLYLGYQTGCSGSYSLSGSGVLNTTADERLGYRAAAAFTQDGGTHTVGGYLHLGGTYTLGGNGYLSANYEYHSGTSTFTQTSGTHIVANALEIAYSGNSSVGNYALGGSGTLSATTECVGRNGKGTFTQTGGTNTVSDSLYVGYYSRNFTSEYNLTDGLLSVGNEYLGNSGSAACTQTGGVHTVSGVLKFGHSSTGSGTYNLNGGTLVVGGMTKGYGSAAFNFGGGTLQAGADLTSSLPMTLTAVGGDANVDTAGHCLVFSGQLSGPGGLCKSGETALTLSGDNSYLGLTTITSGELELVGQNAWNPIVNLGGAYLAGGQLTFDYAGGADPYATILGLLNTKINGSMPLIVVDDIVNCQVMVSLAVPEPSTLLLVATGLLTLLGRTWRLRKHTENNHYCRTKTTIDLHRAPFANFFVGS
jgi:autotransporter-associated beta strand protein